MVTARNTAGTASDLPPITFVHSDLETILVVLIVLIARYGNLD